MTKSSRNLIPEYLQKLKAYSPGKSIESLAREKGLSRISKLASNENPLGPSPYAIKEMTRALWDLHRYPDTMSYKLKSILADHYQLKHENIILGNGSEGVMTYISRALLTPGDEVLTSENTFIGFYIVAQAAGAIVTKAPMTSDYRFDVHALAERITDRTKLIYIANPNNPTGTFITTPEFDQLMKSVPHDCLVILDEAYYEFAQEQKNYPDSMDYRYDNVITLRTFSKAYGLAGIRIGYGFAHEELIENFNKVKPAFEPNLIAQWGACGAVYDQPHLKRTLQSNKKNYEETFRFLTDNGLSPLPSVTNFITFPFGSADKAQRLYEELLSEGVIIRPLKNHGMPDFVRVSLGTDEEMQHFREAMAIALPKINKS